MTDRVILASDGSAASAAEPRWLMDWVSRAGAEVRIVEAGLAQELLEPLLQRRDVVLVVLLHGRDRREMRFATLVATHAAGPVVVVPAERVRRDGPVVVGVGAEDDLDSTLAFGAATAGAGGTELRMIHAWETTGTGEVPPAWDFGTDSIPERQQRALAHLARLARESHPDLIVTAEAVQGPAIPRLADAARTASFLVVGRSHRAAIVQAMFGSTARGLLADAPCPIAVVP